MLSDGLRTALNDNSCEMGGIFCYTQRQVYLLMTILGSFIFVGPLVTFIFCIIDIVKYLKCTPEEFEQTYVIGKKEWF